MKSMQAPSVATFFMIYFTGPEGERAMALRPPPDPLLVNRGGSRMSQRGRQFQRRLDLIK